MLVFVFFFHTFSVTQLASFYRHFTSLHFTSNVLLFLCLPSTLTSKSTCCSYGHVCSTTLLLSHPLDLLLFAPLHLLPSHTLLICSLPCFFLSGLLSRSSNILTLPTLLLIPRLLSCSLPLLSCSSCSVFFDRDSARILSLLPRTRLNLTLVSTMALTLHRPLSL